MVRILSIVSVLVLLPLTGFAAGNASSMAGSANCIAAPDPSVTVSGVNPADYGFKSLNGLAGASELAKVVCGDLAETSRNACGSQMDAVSSDGATITSRDSINQNLNQGADAIEANQGKLSGQFSVCQKEFAQKEEDCKLTRKALDKAAQKYSASLTGQYCDKQGVLDIARENLEKANASNSEAQANYATAEAKFSGSSAAASSNMANLRSEASRNSASETEVAGSEKVKIKYITPDGKDGMYESPPALVDSNCDTLVSKGCTIQWTSERNFPR